MPPAMATETCRPNLKIKQSELGYNTTGAGSLEAKQTTFWGGRE